MGSTLVSIATSTTPQAVSRVLSRLGYGQAVKNKSIRCRAQSDGTVVVTTYPGSPVNVAAALAREGYVCDPQYRCVVVRGKC